MARPPADYDRCKAINMVRKRTTHQASMKQLVQSVIIAVVTAGTFIQPVQATLITGSLTITGQATFNPPVTSVNNASAVNSWVSPLLTGTSTGSFATIPSGTSMTFAPGPWNLNTSSPTTNFWSVGGFKFELQSSQILSQSGGFIHVRATGIVTGNGYTPTAYSWNFSSQDPSVGIPPVWTFSASCLTLNSNGAPVLLGRSITNATVLTWSDPSFTLQSGLTPTGPYTNVPGATSPYTNHLAVLQQYFRLNQ